VTAYARVGDAGMIKIGRRDKSYRVVTAVAGITARDVCRVFAGCYDTVVTGATGTNHLGVIYGDSRYPHRRAVTILTNVRCLNVCLILPGRLCSIVAADTVAEYIHMREIRR